MLSFIRRFLAWFRNIRIISRLRKYNRIGNHVSIHPLAKIGKGCRIGNNVVIAADVEIGDCVTIGAGAFLEKISIGDHSIFEGRAIITGCGKGRISIGKESFVGNNAVLDWSDFLTIGNYVHIGYNHFWTHSSASQALNSVEMKDKNERTRPTAPIVIEDNVYIGVHSTIYPGVTIGHHTVVAPNSVVSKDVLPYSMMGGIPAKLLKSTKEMLLPPD
jgi:acetyltransferase-like isoleucine patch superfamily enzyme